MNLKKLVAGVVLTAFALPTMAFGATVNINLKDKSGNDLTDFTGMEVKILDSIGGVAAGPIVPTGASMSIPNLTYTESYNIILKTPKSFTASDPTTVTVNNYMTKSLRFENDEETVTKNFLLSDQPLPAPKIRLSGMSDCAGQSIAGPLKIKLYPLETSTRDFSVESFESTITKTGNFTFDNNGSMADVADLQHGVPSGSYKYSLSFGAGAACLADWTAVSLNPIRINPNSAVFINAGLTKALKITSNFKLRNASGADINLDGSHIVIEAKEKATGAVVYTKAIDPQGLQASDVSDTLAQKEYEVKYTLTKNSLSAEAIRNVSLLNSPKNVNINFTEPTLYQITFKPIDTRTGATLMSGQMVIKDSADQVLDTKTIDGNPIVVNLLRGKQYKISVTSTGYNERKSNFYPRENRTVELGLSKAQ